MKGKPTIANVSMTLADTEYSYTLPVGSVKFTFQLRQTIDDGGDVQVAFVQGESNTTYMNIISGTSWTENSIKGGGTLYFRSSQASRVAEILTWK